MRGVCDCEGWAATRIGDRVRVTGRCTCPRAGYGLRLRPAPGDQPPGRLVLDLHVESPEMAATVVTTTEVTWEGDAGAEVREVEVRARDATGGVVVPVSAG